MQRQKGSCTLPRQSEIRRSKFLRSAGMEKSSRHVPALIGLSAVGVGGGGPRPTKSGRVREDYSCLVPYVLRPPNPGIAPLDAMANVSSILTKSERELDLRTKELVLLLYWRFK